MLETTNERSAAPNLGTLWDGVERYLAAEKIELDDLELIGRGRTRRLRVVVDSDEPLALDRIAQISRGLSRLLDAPENDIEGSYQLEVTSPGLERKLTRPRHYLKSIGREAVVKTQGDSRRGTIEKADDHGFALKTDEGTITVAYSEVLSARTVFTWEKPVKPGSRGGSA